MKKDVDDKEEIKKEEECEKCAEYMAGWKRALADYQNLQKETTRQIDDFRKYSNEDLILQLIPLADYFKHAFDQIPEAEKESPWLQGIKHIQSYFNKILQDNGVTEMACMGEKFNPEFHDIAAEEESDEEEGKIIKINQAGFILNDKVIRPAKVIISKKGGEKK